MLVDFCAEFDGSCVLVHFVVGGVDEMNSFFFCRADAFPCIGGYVNLLGEIVLEFRIDCSDEVAAKSLCAHCLREDPGKKRRRGDALEKNAEPFVCLQAKGESVFVFLMLCFGDADADVAVEEFFDDEKNSDQDKEGGNEIEEGIGEGHEEIFFFKYTDGIEIIYRPAYFISIC